MYISPEEPLQCMVNMNLIDLHNAPVIHDFCYHSNRIITPHQPLHFVNFCLGTMAK